MLSVRISSVTPLGHASRARVIRKLSVASCQIGQPTDSHTWQHQANVALFTVRAASAAWTHDANCRHEPRQLLPYLTTVATRGSPNLSREIREPDRALSESNSFPRRLAGSTCHVRLGRAQSDRTPDAIRYFVSLLRPSSYCTRSFLLAFRALIIRVWSPRWQCDTNTIRCLPV
jgi:hypothetical protein